MLLDYCYSLSMKIPAPFEAMHSGYVILCLHCLVIAQSLLRLWWTHTLPLYSRSLKSLFICLTSNSLVSEFPNHFIFNNLHFCFAVPFHSLGHANVYCLMLIKTPTSGCNRCMLAYLLSLIPSVFPCLWEVSCGPSTVFQFQLSGSSTSWHGVFRLRTLNRSYSVCSLFTQLVVYCTEVKFTVVLFVYFWFWYYIEEWWFCVLLVLYWRIYIFKNVLPNPMSWSYLCLFWEFYNVRFYV